MPRTEHDLTFRNEQFCQEYVANFFNGTKAAIASGSPEAGAHVTANRLLKDVKIQSRIAEIIKDRETRTQITTDAVLAKTWEVFQRCMQEVPVLDSDGNETGEYVFKETGALKALELLGRHLMLWGDKRLDVNLFMAQLTKEDSETLSAIGLNISENNQQ